MDDDVTALSTDDASCGSSHGSTKSEKNMADFDEDDVLERLAGNAGAAAAAGVADELDEADMSVSFVVIMEEFCWYQLRLRQRSFYYESFAADTGCFMPN